jgi:trk system potassium uptake protein TrkH
MSFRGYLYILSLLVLFLAAIMLLILPFSWYYADGDFMPILGSIGIIAAIGAVGRLIGKKDTAIRSKDGFLVVFLAWGLYALLGTLPFLMTGVMDSFADAFFESISGLTTTGSSVVSDIESLPHGILFWRSLSHWLGGMGIIVLSLAILPFLGAGGTQLFKTEVPGPTAEKLSPRISVTTKILSSVYLVLTLILIGLLMGGGMSLFDSCCHSFGTIATGGFSTKNSSLGAFNSAYIEWVVIVFMIIAGCSFGLHYRFSRGDFKAHIRNREFLLYIGIIVFVTVFICFDSSLNAMYPVTDSIRHALFQTVSILTTTGYGTADYEGWAPSSQMLILFLMFIGGCAGSTGGGIKVIRVLIMFKFILREITQLLHANAVVPVRVGKVTVPREQLSHLMGFFILFVCTFCAGTFLMSITGLDIETSFSATIAALGNIGPGFGSVGPTENFGHLTDMGKYVLGFLMLMGRLELFAVIIFLSPEYWKK